MTEVKATRSHINAHGKPGLKAEGETYTVSERDAERLVGAGVVEIVGANRMQVKLRGFRELERALVEELPKATARTVLTRAGKAALEPVRQRMAELAPFDPLDRDDDGKHLNETMTTKPARARQARELGTTRQEGVVILTGPAPVGKRARSNAGWQERGTAKMGAHPYARPAADMEGPNAVQSVRDNLASEIDKAKKRIAKKAAKGK